MSKTLLPSKNNTSIITPQQQVQYHQEMIIDDLRLLNAKMALKRIWGNWIAEKLDVDNEEIIEIHDLPEKYHTGNIIILNKNQSYIIAKDQNVVLAFIFCNHHMYSPIDIENPINQCLECIE